MRLLAIADPSTRLLLETIGNPDLDDRLAGDAEASGLAVERFDHPHGEVDVDPPLFAVGATHLGRVELVGDVLACVEALVNTGLSPLPTG